MLSFGWEAHCDRLNSTTVQLHFRLAGNPPRAGSWKVAVAIRIGLSGVNQRQFPARRYPAVCASASVANWTLLVDDTCA